MTFKNFELNPAIEEAIHDLGFVTPTEVQLRAIPLLMQGKDLIVRSKTGSGKTAAFGIPILQSLSGLLDDKKKERPQVLILAPTRELAVQVNQDIEALSRKLPLRSLTVYGQHSINLEIEALNKGATIVVGTPGRVMDHIRQGTLKTDSIRFLVLDEADKMMDMGFLDQVVAIVNKLPKDRNTMLFSATMPFEIQNICWEYMHDPETIEIISETKTVDTIKQSYYRVDHHEKRLNLHRILLMEKPKSCMVFCNTRATVDRVQEFLEKKGFKCDALHGAITQVKRSKTIEQFKKSGFEVLVATDVAARGLHIDDLSLVINYDIPVELDSYVHRIGRTGRAGSGGRAITLVTADDVMSLYAIEEHIGAMIPEEDIEQLVSFDRHRHRSSKSVPTKSSTHSSVKPSIKSTDQKTSPQKASATKGADGQPTHQKPKVHTQQSQQTQHAQHTQHPQHTQHTQHKKHQPTKSHIPPAQEKGHIAPNKSTVSKGRAYSSDEISAVVDRMRQKESTGAHKESQKTLINRLVGGFVKLFSKK